MSVWKNLIIDNFSSEIQVKIKNISELLSAHTKRAYLVGGCVRDLLLNNEIKDLDIEVYDISPEKFDKLMKSSGALGVGKSFFVYKIDDVDLALPRIERKVGVGHKAFEVEITDDEKIASKRRDFSMNAMMINIFTGELLDFWGGQRSIDSKEISLIDENSFKEDSLRVLRAIQFSARFNFAIEKKTLKVMQDIDMSDLTKPRILWEFEKLFNAKHLDRGFVYMYRLGVFEKLFICKLNSQDIDPIAEELRSGVYMEELKAYYFFYIVANMSGFDPLVWLKQIEAPNHYLKTFKNQPFTCRGISDKELIMIAIDMPIKKWLGNYKKDIVERAKQLGIFEEAYSGGITIAQVIEDGFTKEDIKKEYRRRIMEKISE